MATTPPTWRDRFDDTWPRMVRVIGLLMATSEWLWARSNGHPVDAAVLGLAGLLIGLPSVLAKKDDGE